MFGENKVFKKQKMEDYDGTIGITEIFNTIQGEGVLFSGVPATFIRTMNCSLRCYFCDTEFSKGNITKVDAIVDLIVEMDISHQINHRPLVVITGGEPLIHAGIPELCIKLLEKGFAVQIETSASVGCEDLPWLNPFFFLCVSPKTPILDTELEMNADFFKYVITSGEVSEDDGLPVMNTQIKGKSALLARAPEGTPICVTPCDPHLDDDGYQYGLNMKECVSSCMKFGYTMNLQMHKTLGLP